MKKKSYNPFKLVGSWVGALIGWILVAHWISRVDANISFVEALNPILLMGDFSGSFGGFAIAGLIFALIPVTLGFFVGWGIHSIIRKVRH